MSQIIGMPSNMNRKNHEFEVISSKICIALTLAKNRLQICLFRTVVVDVICTTLFILFYSFMYVSFDVSKTLIFIHFTVFHYCFDYFYALSFI